MKYLACTLLIGILAAGTVQAATPRALLITGNGNSDERNPDYPPWVHEFHNDRIVEILGDIAEITVTEDLSVLNNRALARYDLILNNSMFLTPTEKQLDAFYRFIGEGKPYLAMHSGLVTFLNSERYPELMGGRFLGGADMAERLVYTFDSWYGYDYNDQVQHPIVRGLANFPIRDELYFVQTNTEDLEVIARSEHLPVLWQRSWGKGRVMGLALGHGREAVVNAGYQALLKNSVRWLLGYPVLEDITDAVFATGTETSVHYVDLDEIGHHPAGAPLRYQVANNSNTDLVSASIDRENRIRLDFAPGHTGSAVIQVRAEAQGGLADASDFNISVQEKGNGNLARYHGVSVHTSSNEERKFTSDPGYLIDGDFSTRWSSDYRDPSWITLDLREAYPINKVKLFWEAAHGRDYEIQVSNDAENWDTVYERSDSEGGTENIRFDPVTARFIRLYGKERATRWGYSLYQFEVYGENAGVLQARRDGE
ncbi:ThuA domain-containing protein [Microbulbifer sp.]|uniref:ThuA domain-containing protein n=1 Tax=Microbulbifer sp. TaxID=1908541 RepID=UPI003F329608